MKIIVKENRELIMQDADNTQNENEVSAIQIIVPEKYQDWYKKIVFITDNGIVWDLIENDAYTLKRNVTKYGSVKFYISLTKDEQDFRSKEETMTFNENHEVTKKITTEEKSGMEKVIAILEKEITEVNEKEQELTDLINEVQTKLDNGEFNGKDGIDGSNGYSPTIRTIQTADGYNIEITDINGTKTISVLNGEDGAKGEKRRPWSKRRTR